MTVVSPQIDLPWYIENPTLTDGDPHECPSIEDFVELRWGPAFGEYVHEQLVIHLAHPCMECLGVIGTLGPAESLPASEDPLVLALRRLSNPPADLGARDRAFVREVEEGKRFGIVWLMALMANDVDTLEAVYELHCYFWNQEDKHWLDISTRVAVLLAEKLLAKGETEAAERRAAEACTIYDSLVNNCPGYAEPLTGELVEPHRDLAEVEYARRRKKARRRRKE